MKYSNNSIKVELTEKQDIQVFNHILSFYLNDDKTIENVKKSVIAIREDFKEEGHEYSNCLLTEIKDINIFLENTLKIRNIKDDIDAFLIYHEIINDVTLNYFDDEDSKIIVASFNNGTMFLSTHIIPNLYNLYAINVIDDYIQMYKEDFSIYEYNELEDDELYQYFAVNGGEYYTNGLMDYTSI